MKRILIVLMAIVAVAMNVQARDKHFQLELGLGTTFGCSKLTDFENDKLGASINGEIRYAFSKVPLTIGLNVSRTLYGREYVYYTEWFRRSISWDFFYTNVLLTCDYYFNVHSDIKLFTGAGIGMCNIGLSSDIEIMPDTNGTALTDSGTSGTASFAPRVGAVFFDKLRLTLGYKFQERANRGAFLTAGWVIRF